MKKFGLILGAFMAMQGGLWGALPPLYQGLAELKAILNNSQLSQQLQAGEVITSIKKTDHGYQIITNQHTLDANVVFKEQAQPGPAQFDIKFSNLKPLK
jgi:hypothetical protein